LITGMGPRNAARVLRAALALARPRLVLSCGFAGALNPQLARGDLVFAADDPFPLRPVLLELGARPIQFHGVDRIIATAAEKAGLWKTTGADAVDMESSAIRALCREANLPSAIVRVISDAAQDDLPLDFNQYVRPDQGLHYGKLLLGLLASPRAIKPLITLNQHTRAGARKLGAALAAALNAMPPIPVASESSDRQDDSPSS
jgi:adenosylhomocysteine nucleosidase